MKLADFDAWTRERQVDTVSSALERWVPGRRPAGLGEAMRYGVLDGGKRVRPLLVLAAARPDAGPSRAASTRPACAVEMIHAYSLVHDDMPCMDNDVLRRGKATVHVRYGQARPCSPATQCGPGLRDPDAGDRRACADPRPGCAR